MVSRTSALRAKAIFEFPFRNGEPLSLFGQVPDAVGVAEGRNHRAPNPATSGCCVAIFLPYPLDIIPLKT